MGGIRWRDLHVALCDGLADRAAIHDERFPAALVALGGPTGWFTPADAIEVLANFAGWTHLGRRPNDPAGQRSCYLTFPEVGTVRFDGQNLSHPNNQAARIVVFRAVRLNLERPDT